MKAILRPVFFAFCFGVFFCFGEEKEIKRRKFCWVKNSTNVKFVFWGVRIQFYNNHFKFTKLSLSYWWTNNAVHTEFQKCSSQLWLRRFHIEASRIPTKIIEINQEKKNPKRFFLRHKQKERERERERERLFSRRTVIALSICFVWLFKFFEFLSLSLSLSPILDLSFPIRFAYFWQPEYSLRKCFLYNLSISRILIFSFFLFSFLYRTKNTRKKVEIRSAKSSIKRRTQLFQKRFSILFSLLLIFFSSLSPSLSLFLIFLSSPSLLLLSFSPSFSVNQRSLSLSLSLSLSTPDFSIFSVCFLLFSFFFSCPFFSIFYIPTLPFSFSFFFRFFYSFHSSFPPHIFFILTGFL